MKHILCAVAPLALLAACSNQQQADRSSKATEAALAATSDHEARSPSAIKPTRTVFLGKTHTAAPHGDLVPDRLNGPQGFRYVAAHGADRLTLAQIAARISKYTGLAVNTEEGGHATATASAPAR